MIPGEKPQAGGYVISRGRIQRILSPGEEEEELLNLNLHGLSIYPGLINAHDTLLASYHAFSGEKRPYHNWLAWDNDVKSSSLFKERMLLEPETLYQLGAYRNLIAGTTSVLDHIPHFVRKAAPADLPVYLFPDFGLSHSVCSYSLDWGEGIAPEYKRAQKLGLPYITHIAEGFDRESTTSLRNLDREGGLGENTLLVHGLSLSEADMDLIAEKKASLVWCPVSNKNIYEKTAPIKELLERGVNICLGTDSAMTGSVNMIDELQGAIRQYGERYGEDISPSLLLEMATRNAARALRQPDRGTPGEDSIADLLVIKGKYPRDPYRSLLEAELKEIYLVIRDGVPLYGEESLEPIFIQMGVTIDRVNIQGTPKIVTAGLKNLLESVSLSGIANGNFSFLPVST